MARSTITPSKPATKKPATPTSGSRASTSRIRHVPAPPAASDMRTEAEVPGDAIGCTQATEDAQVTGPELKKQELIAKVMDKTDAKKKDAKPVVEAVLEVLGEALADGRELNLPPLGKVKINRIKDMGNARIIVSKIRQSKSTDTDSGTKADASDIDPLAAAAE